MSNSETMIIGPGVGHYLALNRPDTKFDELGQYKADIVLSAEAAEPYIKKLNVRAKAHLGKPLAKSGNSVFAPVLDDEGEPTGDILFKMRVKNRLNKEGKLWDRRPMAIDAKKSPMDADVLIYGGSVMKVKVEVYEWAFGGKKGISLQPQVVQVIELKTGGGSVDTSDFDEEDGYEAEAGVDTSDFDASDDSGSDETDGDY